MTGSLCDELDVDEEEAVSSTTSEAGVSVSVAERFFVSGIARGIVIVKLAPVPGPSL
jgi:hypothetical protein